MKRLVSIARPAPVGLGLTPANFVGQRFGPSGVRPKEQAPLEAARPNGAGAPLPPLFRQEMEQAFGTDFSSVRIHEGPEASALGAKAYACGSDLLFAPGAYDPKSRTGRELIAHELTHIVQQRAKRVPSSSHDKVAINRESALENEAESTGRRVARGLPATRHEKSLARHSVDSFSSVVQLSKHTSQHIGTTKNQSQSFTFANYTSDENHRATKAVAAIFPGDNVAKADDLDLGGTAPTRAKDDEPTGWNEYVEHLPNYLTNWKRMHLINEKLGGLGHWFNLTPGRTLTNNEMSKKMEEPAKAHAAKNQPIWYEVRVDYHEGGESPHYVRENMTDIYKPVPAEGYNDQQGHELIQENIFRFFPETITVKWGDMVQDSGGNIKNRIDKQKYKKKGGNINKTSIGVDAPPDIFELEKDKLDFSNTSPVNLETINSETGIPMELVKEAASVIHKDKNDSAGRKITNIASLVASIADSYKAYVENRFKSAEKYIKVS